MKKVVAAMAALFVLSTGTAEAGVIRGAKRVVLWPFKFTYFMAMGIKPMARLAFMLEEDCR